MSLDLSATDRVEKSENIERRTNALLIVVFSSDLFEEKYRLSPALFLKLDWGTSNVIKLGFMFVFLPVHLPSWLFLSYRMELWVGRAWWCKTNHDVSNLSNNAALIHLKKDQLISKTVNISRTADLLCWFLYCVIYCKLISDWCWMCVYTFLTGKRCTDEMCLFMYKTLWLPQVP